MSEAPKDPSEQQADAMDVEIANGETSQPVESQSIVNTFISSLEIVEKLVLELHDALENLHEEAHKKQVAANKAKNEIATVENQLRALLTMTDFTGVLKLNRVSSQPQPKGNATPRSQSEPQEPSPPLNQSEPQEPPSHRSQSEPQGPSHLIEKGKCKFSCGSRTHQYATQCDIYVTLSERSRRMDELCLCRRCFQQHVGTSKQNAECEQVPCFYCARNNRNALAHVSALCPYMFAM